MVAFPRNASCPYKGCDYVHTCVEPSYFLHLALIFFCLVLRAQFSKITEFFVDVASLVRDVMAPSVGDWAKALANTMTKLAGVSLSGVCNIVICLTLQHWHNIDFHLISYRHCEANYIRTDAGTTQGFSVVRENCEHLPQCQPTIHHACSAVSLLSGNHQYSGLMYLLIQYCRADDPVP